MIRKDEVRGLKIQKRVRERERCLQRAAIEDILERDRYLGFCRLIGMIKSEREQARLTEQRESVRSEFWVLWSLYIYRNERNRETIYMYGMIFVRI